MSLQLHMHRGGRTLAEVSGLQTVSSERNIKTGICQDNLYVGQLQRHYTKRRQVIYMLVDLTHHFLCGVFDPTQSQIWVRKP